MSIEKKHKKPIKAETGDTPPKSKKDTKAAHKKTEEQIAFQASVWNNMQDAVIATDISFKISAWNKAATEVYGWTAGEVIGKNSRDILRGSITDTQLKELLGELAQKGQATYETTQRNKNGSSLEIEAKLITLKDNSGKVTGYISANRNITERKKAEEALKESEERFSKAFRSSPTALAITRISDGTFIDINDSYENLMGYTREEIIGNNPMELNIYVNPQQRTEIIRLTTENGNVRDKELTFRKKDGQLIETICSLEVIRVRDEEFFLSTILDITERKKAEEALHKSESNYRRLFNNMSEGFAQCELVLDKTGKPVDYVFLNANPRSEEFTGRTVEQIIGKRILSLFPNVQPKTFELFGKVVTTGEPAHFENYSRDLHRWFDVHAFKTGPKQFAYTLINITDRKQAEEALKESEERFRAIADNTPDHVLVQDTDLRYTFVVNPQVGLTVNGMLGKTDFEILAKADAEKLTEIKRQVIATGKPFHLETSLVNKEGKLEFFSGAYVPKYNRERYADGLIGYFQNITERKQAEFEIHRINRELQAIIECDQVITHASDEQTLLSDICHILCNSAGYLLAWVASVEDDEAKSMRPIAWCGDEEYVTNARITWADSERGRGPSGLAARNNKTYYFQDFASEPTASPWREAALLRGFRSSIALPLADNCGKVYAVLTLYSVTPKHFTSSEIRLLETLASDLTFGINGLREQQKRKQAEAEITHLASFPMLNPNPILELDFEGNLKFANTAAKAVFPSVTADHKQAFWLDLFEAIQKDKAHSITRDILIGDLWYEQVLVFTPPTNSYLLYGRNITSRKRAEEKLQGTQRILEKAQQIAHLGSWEWNIIAGELKWSQELYAIYGVDQASFVPTMTVFADFIHPADKEFLNKVMNQLMTGGQPISLDFRIVLQDSSIRYVHATSEISTRDSSGKPVVYIGTTQDITDRKLAEEALRGTRDYLDNLFNHANAPIIVWNADFEITRFNHAFERLTGRTANEVLGNKLDILFPEESRQTSIDIIHKTQPGERWEIVEIPILNLDGSVHIVLWNSATLYSADGQTAIATIAQGQDITERKKAEEALKESEERFKILAAASPLGIGVVSVPEGKFLFANPAYEKAFGYSKDELLSKKAPDIYWDPSDRERILSVLRKNNNTADYEVKMKRKDGTLFWGMCSARPIIYDNKPALLGAFVDVTARIQAEEAIQRHTQELETYRSHLEETVNHRTQELQSLSHHLISLQEEERRNISRELHDQTGQSLTVLNLLLAKALRSPETSQSDIKEAQQLVKEVLSQVRALSSSLHPGMLEDMGLLPTLQWYLNDFGKKTGIYVNFDYSELDRNLPGDFNITIYRIIQEALTNIVRYAEVKEAAVSLKLKNQTLSIRIEDKGKGFAVKTQPQGVGLRGMRERVNSLKGNLKIHSAPGEGTLIEVELLVPNG